MGFCNAPLGISLRNYFGRVIIFPGGITYTMFGSTCIPLLTAYTGIFVARARMVGSMLSCPVLGAV